MPSGIPSGPPPSVIPKPLHSKIPLKRNKPVLLSEVLRTGGHHPYAKFKPTGPNGIPIKEYIEEDELDTSPFSSIDAVDSLPPTFSKFGRPPPSIEISDEVHDGLAPLGPIEEEIFYPGATNTKPFTTFVKRPMGSTIYSMTKPPDIYMDDELESTIRNVRFAMKPPQNTYIDQDLIQLLQKIKLDGNHLESRPTESSKDNVTDVNAAISKLLLPFLSESAVKKIQSYFKSLPSDKQHKEEHKNVTKVVYIVENHDREFNKNSNESAYKTYTVTQPMRDNDNNTTYFIMLKAADSKNDTSSSSSQHSSNSDNHRDTKKQHEHSTKPPEVKTTTLPSLQSLALQNYIMSLAGLTSYPHENHYLPRFNTFNKQPRMY